MIRIPLSENILICWFVNTVFGDTVYSSKLSQDRYNRPLVYLAHVEQDIHVIYLLKIPEGKKAHIGG